MYFNEICNEVEPSNKEKEKIARQNEHNALVSKHMDVKIDNAIKCQSVLEHPTDESGNIILANFHSNNHFGSRKERQQAQQKACDLNAYHLSDGMFFINDERFVVSMGSVFHHKKNGGNYKVCKLDALSYPLYSLTSENIEKLKAVTNLI